MSSTPRPPRLLEGTRRDDLDVVGRRILSTPERPLSDDARERVWSGFVRRVEGARDAPRSGRVRTLAWAAGAAAAAAVLALVLRLPGRDTEPAGRAIEVGGVARLRHGGGWTLLDRGAPIDVPSVVRVDRGGMADVALARGVDVRIEGPALVRLDPHGAAVESGRALHRVTPGHGRWLVRLGDYRVVVKGTQFWTGRAGEEAAVCLLEGSIEVRRGPELVATLEPGQAWRSSARAPALPGDIACQLVARGNGRIASELEAPAMGSPPASTSGSVSAPPPQGLPPPRSRPRVEPIAAVELPAEPAAPPPSSDRCRDVVDVETCYRDVGNGTTLLAQNAVYRLAEVRRARGDAAGALEAWLEYRHRFPDGVLAQEADLAILETRLRQRSPLAMRAADRFLERWPTSEHSPEVRALRGVLLQRAGSCGRALDDFERALAGRISTGRRDEASYGRAACLAAVGRRTDAADAYRAYLSSHASGRFTGEAREGLRAVESPPAAERDD